MRLKSGVSVRGLRPEMLIAVLAAERIWEEQGVGLVITSGVEGEHSWGSRHYSGLAVDLRTRTLKDPDAAVNELRGALGGDFDVVLEPTHCHVEFDPKTGLNIA